MSEPILEDFVRDAIAKGAARDDIAQVLKKAGWPSDQVDDALKSFADLEFPVPVPAPRKYGSAREAFLYIVYFALLGMVAIFVGGLAFSFIEFIFRDALDPSELQRGVSGMRWAIASLVVGYPIFIFLGRRLAAARRADPNRRTSRVSAWLTYVTLIFAALTLIGDLVAVVYQFLAGELGARFLLKALVVGTISGAILWNYTRSAERADSRHDLPGRILAVVATIITAALVIWAFSVVRSPMDARANLTDDARIRDIDTIARLVDCHYTYFGALPETLEIMATELEQKSSREPVAIGCAATLPRDPDSGVPYPYEAIGEERYQLCASFTRGWPQGDPTRNGQRQRWLNRRGGTNDEDRYLRLPQTSGQSCFEFNAVNFSRTTAAN